MRILLVEDDFATRQLLNDNLSRFADVDIAENGLEAVELYTNSYNTGKLYDLLVLSIIMPIINGYQVIDIIRNFEKDHNAEYKLPIVVYSALFNEKNQTEAIERGAEEFFIKPDEYDDMLMYVEKKYNQ